MGLTHKELVEIGYKWVLKNGSCGVAFKELRSYCGEYADVIGFGSGCHSVLVEVKCSRSDFLADAEKPFRKNPELGMGKYRYYLCEDGLIKISDLPEKWGLIYVKDGKAKNIHNPYGPRPSSNIRSAGFEQNIEAEHQLMYSALRRLFIRGHIGSIYDQDFSRSDVNQLITINENHNP